MRFAYGKIGRSMPLVLGKCGNLGGDVEMTAVVKTLALRHPEHEFVLAGRNTGEVPAEAGLPANVTNPWTELQPELRRRLNAAGLNHGNLAIDEHFRVGEIMDGLIGHVFDEVDGVILWIGQHGTTNNPLPGVRKRGLTKPQDAFAYYAAYLLRGVNRWRDVNPWEREPVFLNADSRNYLKMRDMKWPLRHPVLTQMTYTHRIKHARYGDPGPDGAFAEWSAMCDVGLATPEDVDHLWLGSVGNVYSRLEVNGLLPGTPFGDLVSYDGGWDGRGRFGMFINEARAYVGEAVRRVNVVRDWVLPLEPDWLHGTWSADSLADLGRDIRPAPWSEYYPRLHSVRSTFTTPSSGSGFATAKPWEAFAAGTVCFFHPAYDTQDNILADAPAGLRDWLRVSTPDDLRKRVDHLDSDAGRRDWEWLVDAQRLHLDAALADLRYAQMIEERLGV